MTFPLLRISSAALAAAALAGSLAGCAPLVIGGGAVVGTLMATDRRTTGTQVEDEGIEMRTASRIRETLGDRVHVNVTSYNRQVLLTGEAPTAQDRERIEAAIPRGARTVVLDERGTALGTTALAERLTHWQSLGQDVALLIGGPDGLDPALRQSAHERIRLSDLTLPHAMVRVLLVEQLYRAWSLNAGHPYHRA